MHILSELRGLHGQAASFKKITGRNCIAPAELFLGICQSLLGALCCLAQRCQLLLTFLQFRVSRLQYQEKRTRRLAGCKWDARLPRQVIVRLEVMHLHATICPSNSKTGTRLCLVCRALGVQTAGACASNALL